LLNVFIHAPLASSMSICLLKQHVVLKCEGRMFQIDLFCVDLVIQTTFVNVTKQETWICSVVSLFRLFN